MEKLTLLDDDRLIKMYINGNINALGTLVVRYKDKIFQSIYLLVKEKELAEDIFQDLFIKIIEKINSGKYNEEGKFCAWATTIAHNLCVDYFRKQKIRSAIKVRDDLDVFEAIDSKAKCTDDEIISYEDKEAIGKLLDQLSEEQREVVILRHYADLGFREIAAITNCSINTVLGRMRYALINLRKIA